MKYGLPLLVLLFVANHLEYYHRIKTPANKSIPNVVVRSENNFLPSHKTIGIDEKASDNTGSVFLRFATLGLWDFDPKTLSLCPAEIQRISDRDVSCIGFMYPLEAGTKLKSFCLLRTTQTCCYGPRPQYNQYLLVEMKEPAKFERLKPVVVQGKFFVDPQPSQGFIYRMEGKSVVPIVEDEPDVNPADAARKANLPLFDFAPLAEMGKQNSDTVPGQLQALDDKQVLVAGYFLNRVEGASPRILVGCEWWDGATRGKRPTIYNAVMVFPKDVSQMPPLWKDRGIVSGVLHVEKDAVNWPKSGIASLREATLDVFGSQPAVQPKPVLSPLYEVLLASVFLCVVFLAGRGTRDNISSTDTTANNRTDTGVVL